MIDLNIEKVKIENVIEEVFEYIYVIFLFLVIEDFVLKELNKIEEENFENLFNIQKEKIVKVGLFNISFLIFVLVV